MDELQALKTENELVKQVLNNVRAEKIAIDQVCLINIQDNIKLRTQTILDKERITKLESELSACKEELKTKENLVDIKDACAQ